MTKKIKIAPYINIESSLFLNKHLTNTDRVLYGWILALSANEDNHCFAHTDYLCRLIGIKERQLRKCLIKLKEQNYIMISHEKGKRFLKPRIYYLMEERDKENIDNDKPLILYDYNWLEDNREE